MWKCWNLNEQTEVAAHSYGFGYQYLPKNLCNVWSNYGVKENFFGLQNTKGDARFVYFYSETNYLSFINTDFISSSPKTLEN